MRYAYGVLIGFIIPGIIFMGAAAIRLMHFGLPEGDTTVYGPLFLWTLVAIALLCVPLLILKFLRKPFFHEFFLYIVGGFTLFTPFWIALGAEVSGDPWTRLYFDFSENGGLVGVIPFPARETPFVWLNIGAFLYIPITAGLIFVGLFLIRPSHVQKFMKPTRPSEIAPVSVEPKPPHVEPAAPTPTPTPIDTDVPPMEPPPISQSNIDELRSILTKLNTPEATITAIMNAGFASTTDLIATTPEQLANVTGLDKMTAGDLQMEVQKVLFYGHIVD